MSILGNRLRQARKRKSFTQKYVAKKIGITYQAISNYERGERDPDTEILTKLANLYGVSIDWLVGNTDDPTPLQVLTILPTPEEQVLSAKTPGEAIRKAYELYDKGEIDENEYYRLNRLTEKKFTLLSTKSPKAASAGTNIPGSGILGDDKNEENDSGNAEKHS